MEKTISVTEARQSLLQLTRQVAERMDRWVLTNKGVAETVLMSVGEYQSLRAAAELIKNPEALAASQRGFAELDEGSGVPMEQAFGVRREPHAGEPGFPARRVLRLTPVTERMRVARISEERMMAGVVLADVAKAKVETAGGEDAGGGEADERVQDRADGSD